MLTHNIKEHITAGKVNPTWISIALVILFWLADSVIDVFVFNEGTFISQTFAPSLYELWTRLLICSIMILAVYAAFNIVRRKQIEEHLRSSEETIKKSHALLEAINRTQSQFIVDTEPADIFNSILDSLLSLTRSKYGFIGEILFTAEGRPYLKTHAITNIAWNEETRSFYEKFAPNMEFYNLKTLFGEVMLTGKPVVSNNPSSNPRRGGLPQGHPSLDCFLGIPFYQGNTMVGMVGIANRPAGYDENTIEYLQPLLITCGNIIEAYRNNQRREQAEAAIKDISRQQKAILNNIPDIAWLKDKEGRFITVNEPFSRACGLKQEELSGKTDLDIWPLELAERYRTDDIEVMAYGKRKIVEEPLADKEGKIYWIETIKTPIYSESHEVIGTTGIARDITERKKSDAALKESEERYRNLFENAHDLIQSIAPDGHIIYVNPAWLSTMGYTLEELRQMTVFDVLHPDYKNHCMSTLKHVISGASKNNIETVFVSKDGRSIHVEGTASVLLVDGTAVACNGIFRDITERRKMEERLFRITHDWEDTFNTITDMITVHDKDFNIVHANKAAEKLLSLPVLNAASRKCYQYYHGTGHPPEGCPSCDCLKTGLSSTSEIYEPHLKMFIEIRAIPRFDSNNNLVGLIHVVRDISEQKKLEEQLRQSQKMEAVGELAGGIAHDFNNLLTAIIGYTNILKIKMAKDDYLKDNLDYILTCTERGAHLTQSLLAFSRQQISNPEPVRINEIIKNIESLLSSAINEDIELKTILKENPAIMADRMQIEQVLINLATNARDAMPDGGILMIGTGQMEVDREFTKACGYGEPGTYAVISVSDTGTGMDEQIKAKIFEPFFTTKEVGKGTGLGLSIVYGIIKQHKGYITCYSEKGKGTTFKIYLPAVELEVKETGPKKAIEPAHKTSTILLAEDESAVRKLTRNILEEYGYKVIEAVDGEDAVNKFIENRDEINMLMFDIIMPGMSGKEAYDKIKVLDSGIKVLLTSGYPSDFIHQQKIIEQGLSFTTKPISPKGLMRKVQEVLGK